MAERYTDRIETYCRESGVAIPPGFYRHPASRYAAIDAQNSPPRLIARTWFKLEDVAHYLRMHAADRPMRVLDFKDRQELNFTGSAFIRVNEF